MSLSLVQEAISATSDDGRAIFSTKIRFYAGTVLWSLVRSLYRTHVMFRHKALAFCFYGSI